MRAPRNPAELLGMLADHFDELAGHAQELVAELKLGQAEQAQARADAMLQSLQRSAAGMRSQAKDLRSKPRPSHVPVPWRK